MDQDKALRKVLETIGKGDLPYGFESRWMKNIQMEAKKKRRRSAVLSLCLVSGVSLLMIVGTILLLHNYLAVRIYMPVVQTQLSPDAGSMFGFFFYIAFLVLILLGFDTYFRGLRQKPKE